MSQTSQRPKKVGDLVSDKIYLSRHVEIDLAGLRHVCDFFRRKQVLSKIEAVEFRNDKRTNFSQQSTNQQPACYDVINDDINDVPHNADHRFQPSRLATCYTHHIVASSAGCALPFTKFEQVC